MIAKAVWLTHHARVRMHERGIRRRDIRFVLARGNRQVVTPSESADVCESRAYLGRREAAVLFVENAWRYLVITVKWTDEQ